MNHFRHYLLGQNFLLRTDHGSLRWIFDFKDPRGQVARWLEVLAQYDFDIEHRPGVKHQNADSLSRKDFEQTNCDHAREDSETCLDCIETSREWEQFLQEVDDVVDLGQSVPNTHVREVTMTEHYCLRAFTRGQAKKLVTDKEPVKPSKRPRNPR